MIHLAFAWLAADAHAVQVSVEICVDFEVQPEDPHGDFGWSDAIGHRFARGLRYRIVDDVAEWTGWLDDDTGCVSELVEVSGANRPFTFQVRSHALVDGVELRTHVADLVNGALSAGDAWGTWQDQFHSHTWTMSANSSPIGKTLPPSAQWESLAVLTWMFHRNDFHLSQGVSRACCTEGSSGYDDDGTCPTSNYSAVSAPLHVFQDASESGCPNGGGNGNGTTAEPLNTVWISGTCPNISLLAHEVGHGIVAMRMGGLEQYDLTASTDDCSGDRDAVGGLLDPGGVGARGQFTKEYTSDALREGWGDFVAAWAFNSRVQSDCEFLWLGGFDDFDLDGTLDNDFTSSDPWLDYSWDCIGTPYLGTDPTPLAMDGANWLDDLEDYADAAGCDVAADPGEANRATVYDVTKFFWAATSHPTAPIPPEDLADVYVDMCPRGWSANDAEWATDALPINRLQASGQHHTAYASLIDAYRTIYLLVD